MGGEGDEEETRQWVEPTRLRAPEPTGLGIIAYPPSDDDEPRQQSSPPNAIVDQHFEWLMMLSGQFESAAELSSSLQVPHAAAQSTIPAY